MSTRRPRGLTCPRDRMIVEAYYDIHNRFCPRALARWYKRFVAALGPILGPRALSRIRQGEFAPGVGERLPARARPFVYWERTEAPCRGPYGPQEFTWVCRRADGSEVYRGPSVLTWQEIVYRLRNQQKQNKKEQQQ